MNNTGAGEAETTRARQQLGVTGARVGKPREVAPGVHVVDMPQPFLGLELGARMTVLQLGDDLLVYSPVAVDPETIAHLGTPRWLLAPNLFHHLHAGPWAAAGLEAWAAPGLPHKRTDIDFQGVIDSRKSPFGDEVGVAPLSCLPLTNEVLMLHRPSRTLVVCDLVFNLPPTAPWLTRAAMRCLGGYPGCKTTLLERVGMRRRQAREDMRALAEWDFDRVIMAHGDIIETGGKAAVIQAFSWLSLEQMGLSTD